MTDSPGQQRRKAASLKRSSQDNHVDRVANGILIIACTANAGAAASIEALLEREPEPMSRHVPVADVITITPGALYAIRSIKM
jgi:hypothetical protein